MRSAVDRWSVAAALAPDAHGLGDGSASSLRGAAATADAGALVHQGGHAHPPAVAHVPDAVRIGDPHFGQVHLVELGLARDLNQGANLDSGSVHIESEVGEPLVLGHVRIGPGYKHAPVSDVGQRVPDLLAGDHPFVAVAHGPAGQAGQIRTGAGFAEQLAPGVLAREAPAQEAGLEVVAAVGDHGRPGHRQAEEVPAVGRLGPGPVQAGVDVTLESGCQSEPAPTLGEVHPRQTQVVLATAEVKH